MLSLDNHQKTLAKYKDQLNQNMVIFSRKLYAKYKKKVILSKKLPSLTEKTLPLIVHTKSRMNQQIGQQLPTQVRRDGPSWRVHAPLHQRWCRGHINILGTLVVCT